MNQNQPRSSFKKIGLIDSGLGGLTVLQKLIKTFPAQYLYLADTKNLPYGDKTQDQLREIALKNVSFLVAQGVDSIVFACHTLSAVALPEIRDTYQFIIFYDVIQPTISKVINLKLANIGIMATAASIKIGLHKKLLLNYDSSLNIVEKACPDLVPLIEQFPLNESRLNERLMFYLEPMIVAKVDAIVLGCTHYSLIQEHIKKIVGPSIELISAEQEIILSGEYNSDQLNNIELYITKSSPEFELNCRNVFSSLFIPTKDFFKFIEF